MDAAKVDWEFTNYSGAVHCFAERDANSPPGCQYNERAAKRAWKALDEFSRNASRSVEPSSGSAGRWPAFP